MIKKTVRKQVLLSLTFTFVILITTFITTSYHLRSAELSRAASDHRTAVENTFSSLMSLRIKYMNSLAEFIAEHENFQKAMINSDRKALLANGKMIFERISDQMGITHFYFHNSRGEILLRVYQPENISAASHKFVIQKAVEKKETVAGLELGRNGTFTLRLVFPWFINSEFAGYIEIGQEVDNILKELKSILDTDFIVTLNKQYLQQKPWENGMKIMGREPDWELLPGRVIVENSLSMDKRTEIKIVNESLKNDRTGRIIKADKIFYRLNSLPLVDVAGRPICEVVFINDVTIPVQEFRIFVGRVTFFSLILCSALFTFAFKLLGRVDRELKQTGEQLRKELRIKEETAENLKIEVTERRKAEHKLKSLNENLEKRVHERTSELHKANTELEEGRLALEEAYKDLKAQHNTILQQDKMACIGQLAASVAHDINNPVGFVAGNMPVLIKYMNKMLEYIKLCENYAEKSGIHEVQEELRIVKDKLKIEYISSEIPVIMSECIEGLERISRIVLNLKGFSSIDEKEACKTDIHQCIDSTISIVMHEVRHKAEISRNYGDVPEIMCNPQQISQVFMNLLINASQAIEEWGSIIISTSNSDKHLLITIEDTGKGISEENMGSIFDPFFTTKKTGTGLGLSIVSEIIKNHNGEISVESRPGKTVFTIALPLC